MEADAFLFRLGRSQEFVDHFEDGHDLHIVLSEVALELLYLGTQFRV